MTWPEVLLTYGRDSSLGSRLTEHQVSEQRVPFCFWDSCLWGWGWGGQTFPWSDVGDGQGRHQVTFGVTGRWQKPLRTGRH